MFRHPEPHTPLAWWLTALMLALALLHAPAARAQTPAPLAEWQYSVGVPLVEMFQGPARGLEIPARRGHDRAAALRRRA